MGPCDTGCAASWRNGLAGAAKVAGVEGASEGALGFEDGGRVAVVGVVSRSSYMGFLSCWGVG